MADDGEINGTRSPAQRLFEFEVREHVISVPVPSFESLCKFRQRARAILFCPLRSAINTNNHLERQTGVARDVVFSTAVGTCHLPTPANPA